MNFLLKIEKFQKNFFKVDDKIINKKTKFLYILYIVLLTFMLASFLNKEENSIKKPSLLYPEQCRSLVKNKEITLKNLLERKYQADEIYQDEGCFLILSKAENFQKEEKKTLEKIKLLQKQSLKFKEENKALLEAYPTILKEKMASVDINSSILDVNYQNAKARKIYLDENLQKVEKEEQALSEKIMRNPQSQEINLLLKQKQELLEKFSRASFYYPLKIFLYSFFWLAIFVLLSKFFQNSLIKKGNFLVAKLFSYNINISALFLLYFFIKFLKLILPKFLIAKIIAFLTKYNLLFLFQYFILFAFIFLFILLIKFFQRKKVKNYDKEDKERIFKIINQNLCSKCFSKIDGDFCKFCGEKSYKFCPKCQNKSGSSDIFCAKCGEKF